MSKAIKIFPSPPPSQIIVEGFDFWPISSWFRKREQKRIESIDRQMKLRQFWFDEQIRVRPNMKFFMSGSSFEKVDFPLFLWTYKEQLMAQCQKGHLEQCSVRPHILRSKDGTTYDMDEIDCNVMKAWCSSLKNARDEVFGQI